MTRNQEDSFKVSAFIKGDESNVVILIIKFNYSSHQNSHSMIQKLPSESSQRISEEQPVLGKQQKSTILGFLKES